MSGRANLYGALGIGALTAGALTYTALADPHRPGFLFPGCPFLALTGWYCPFCGGLRMTHAVLHGDWSTAVHDNVFLLAALPLLALWAGWRLGTKKPLLTRGFVVTVLVALLAWTVVRNVPGFPLTPEFSAR
ncbi:DUF2752 domain-containing protein [Mycolicibacterium brumae]|nr:DUF2752 domain-containing protein [Mycolicibacterium brumae]RWA22946.1 hypothetical protein MBRU_11440 [Mycolicibacterium brumae DSM 44177]UWW08956.1 DUF2752 domain-containing protein [Mycolicibacterium brumae]